MFFLPALPTNYREAAADDKAKHAYIDFAMLNNGVTILFTHLIGVDTHLGSVAYPPWRDGWAPRRPVNNGVTISFTHLAIGADAHQGSVAPSNKRAGTAL